MLTNIPKTTPTKCSTTSFANPNITRMTKGIKELRNRIAINNFGGLPDFWLDEGVADFVFSAAGAPDGLDGCLPRPPKDEAPGRFGGI
jgi:hypothetical protein